ncbi:hypothetical protein DFH07DRAFT_767744 [Mycena maculata]|uniref:Uncharacterized protein n=1 Tax=Mycena maculata TaxID=230809 RepID=A0AAD7JZX5_9AGAR|nr:hypothetical protein DFH07DRAFT_767744 [Mycena maculata]
MASCRALSIFVLLYASSKQSMDTTHLTGRTGKEHMGIIQSRKNGGGLQGLNKAPGGFVLGFQPGIAKSGFERGGEDTGILGEWVVGGASLEGSISTAQMCLRPGCAMIKQAKLKLHVLREIVYWMGEGEDDRGKEEKRSTKCVCYWSQVDNYCGYQCLVVLNHCLNELAGQIQTLLPEAAEA